MEFKDTEHITEEEKQEILRQRAKLLQIDEEVNLYPGKHIDCLIFRLANENYAIDSTYVNEVVNAVEITPLPCTPSFLVGIINLRGKILSIIDLKSFLNLKGSGETNLTQAIIVSYNGIELGILSDEILGNKRIYEDTLQKKLSTIIDIPENFIIGLSKNNVIVLDIKKFLSNENLIISEDV